MRSITVWLSAASVTLLAIMIGCQGSKLTASQVRGKQIYESLCDKCHKLIPPKAKSDDEWRAAVDTYGTQLKLGESELAQLKDYLTRANDADF